MSAFCPNLSNKQVKRDFTQLKDMVGNDLAYYLWDKYEGDMSQALIEAQDIQSQTNIQPIEQKGLHRRKNFTATEFAASQRLSTVLRQLFPEISVEYVDSMEDGYVGKAEYEALRILVHNFESTHDTEPHEYAHFYIEMFLNSELVQSGIKEFGSKEALVQAVGVRTVDMDGKARTWWQKFKDFVKKLLNKNKYAKEALLAELTDAFLTRQDLGEGVSIYDLLGIDYQEKLSITQVRHILQNKASQISFDTHLHQYKDKKTGKVLKSVSQIKEELKYSTYDQSNEDELQSQISDEARINGTGIHAVFEKIFLGTFNPKEFQDTFSTEALKQIYDIAQKLKQQYDWVASESVLADAETGVAGTADLIMQDKKTGEFVLFDFKSKMTKYNGKNENKKGKPIRGFAYVTSKFFSLLTQRDGYDFQLSCYQKMLQQIGVPVKMKAIIPITYEVNKNKVTAVYVSKFFGNESSDKHASEILKKEGYYPLETPKNIQYDVDTKVFGEQNEPAEKAALRGKMIDDLRDIAKNIIDHLNLSKDILRIKGLRKQSGQAAYLLEQLDDLQELDVLLKYLNFGVDQLGRINKTIEKFYAKGVEADWNLDYLQGYKDVAASYQMIGKISGIVDRYSQLLDKKDVERIKIACNKIQSLQRSIVAAYDGIGSEIYLDAVMPYVKNVENTYRKEYQKEFRKNNPKLTSETDNQYKNREKKYVDSKVAENKDEIDAKTKEWTKQQMSVAESGFECTSLFANVNSVYESKDPLVQSTVLRFDEAMMENTRNMLTFKAKLQKIYKEFRKKYPVGNTAVYKEIFDDLIEYTEDGQCYLVNHLSGKYLEAEKKAFADIRNNPQLDYSAKMEARERWLDQHCPISDMEAYLNERKLKYEEWFSEIKDEKVRKAELKALEDNEKLPADKKQTLSQLQKKNKISFETRSFLEDLDYDLHKKYRRPNPSIYQNDKYQKLLKLKKTNDPKWQMYKLFLDIIEEMDQYMTGSARGMRLNYRLPGIIRRGMETVNQDGVVSGVKESLKKDMIVMQDDEIRGTFVNEQGQKINQVPHFYHRGVKESEQSFDLPTIFYKWYESANTWRVKKQMESFLLKTQAILHERETEDKTYSLLNKQRKEKTSSNKPNTAHQYDRWLDQVFYGNRLDDMGTLKIPFSEKRIDVAKFIKSIVAFASKRTMLGNTVSGINNAIIGEVNQVEEALAKQFLSPRAYHKASKMFAMHMKEMVADFNRPVPQDKLNRLAEYFGIFESGKNQSLVGFMRHSLDDYGYIQTKMGEREMQTRFIVGLLCEQQAIDEKGNILGDMVDFVEVNDDMELVVDPRVVNFNRSDVNRFSIKARRIMMGLHGNYSDWSLVGIQSKWYGFMGLALRRWIAPNIERRFAKRYFDNITGEEREGFYRTGASYWIYENPYMATVWNFVAQNVLRIEKYQIQAVKWNELDDIQKQNVIRFSIEIGVAALGYLIYMLVGNIDGSDDDEFLSMIRYQSYRIFTDLTFFFLPTSFTKILQDPFPVMGLMNDVSSVFLQIFDPFEEYQNGNHLFDNKLIDKSIKLTPGLKQIGRFENIASEMEYFIRSNR